MTIPCFFIFSVCLLYETPDASNSPHFMVHVLFFEQPPACPTMKTFLVKYPL